MSSLTEKAEAQGDDTNAITTVKESKCFPGKKLHLEAPLALHSTMSKPGGSTDGLLPGKQVMCPNTVCLHVVFPISSIWSRVKYSHIQKCRGTRAWFSFLHLLPTPQPRKDTVKPHFKTLVLSSSLELLPLKSNSHFQLERHPSSLVQVDKKLAQCHQMHHLHEDEELLSPTAVLSPTFPLLRQNLRQPVICS